MKRMIPCVLLLFSFALTASVVHATSHEFFKGKAIRLVVGTSVGGAMDDWGRFVAQHLSRNIPGNPEIIVQNMPGAGTIIAANYIAEHPGGAATFRQSLNFIADPRPHWVDLRVVSAGGETILTEPSDAGHCHPDSRTNFSLDSAMVQAPSRRPGRVVKLHTY